MTAIQYNRHLISLFDIWSTCDNLYLCASLIDLYLADHQLICIWMLFDLVDLTNDDLIQIFI